MDDATIAAAQQGDRAALTRLLRELQDPWHRVCLSLLRDPELARDATQETALRFLRQLHGFRGGSALRTWAMGIAINVAREMRRSSGREGQWSDATVDAPEQAAEQTPLGAAEVNEQRASLHAMLQSLPPRQREAVVLRYFESFSTEETADVMGCAAGTVKATLHQALRTLREKLRSLV